MRRITTIGGIFIAALIAMALWPRSGFADVDTTVTLQDNGPPVVAQSGVNSDPSCFGPLSVERLRFTINNLGSSALSPVTTVTVDPGLHLEDGCLASSGTCTVDNPLKLTWSVTIPGQQSANILFGLRVDAGVPSGTTLCATFTVTNVPGGPVVIPACATTNSSVPCGVGAPVLGEGARVLLVVALAALGALVLHRRRGY